MPRLIDADALPKYTGYVLSASEVAKAVENAPTVDAEPVIRCKDCRFYNTHDHRCVRMNHGFKDDFFCAWGERKEDG